jgi:hypothetical protein
MHPRSRFPSVLVLAIASTALAAVPALGGTVKRIDSTVTLAAHNPFHGHVSSPNHACEVQRKVKVFRKKPGADKLVGKTTTNHKGKWSIPANRNGTFYAKVARRKEGAAGTTFVCRPDTSRTRHFGGGGGY